MPGSDETMFTSAPVISGAFSAKIPYTVSASVPPGIVPKNTAVRSVSAGVSGTSRLIHGLRLSILLFSFVISAICSERSLSSLPICFAVFRRSLRSLRIRSSSSRSINAFPSKDANIDFFSGTYLSRISIACSARVDAFSKPAFCPAVSIFLKSSSSSIT